MRVMGYGGDKGMDLRMESQEDVTNERRGVGRKKNEG
jgi:hypothetical protein